MAIRDQPEATLEAIWKPAALHVAGTALDWTLLLTVRGEITWDPRHTAASLYIAAGTPPKVVQRILGHGSVAITLDLYGHLYPDEMDRWAVRLGEIAERMRPECGHTDDPGGDDPLSKADAGR